MLLLLTVAGCAPTSPAPTAPATHSVLSAFSALTAPFAVYDSTGRLLDLAFVGGVNIPRPQLVDVDGDGDLDLLLQEYTDRLMLFTNEGLGDDGLPRFALASRHYGGLDVGEWSRFADVDGDGLTDVLAEWKASYIRFFRASAVPSAGAPGRRGIQYTVAPDTLRDATGTAIFADAQNIPYIGDINCDSVPDLLIGRITGIILQYHRSAAGPQPVFTLDTNRWQDLEIITGQGSRHGANTMALADYDNDGDLDLFWGDFFEAGLLLFKNNGTCREPRLSTHGIRFPQLNPVVTSGYNAPAFGDLNGDGEKDLVMGVIGGAYDPNRTTVENLYFVPRTAQGRYETRSRQLLGMVDVGSESMPALTDLDGDGDLDLLLSNKIDPQDRKTSRIYYYRNDGSDAAPSYRQLGALAITGAYHYAPAFGDLDGDGTEEMVLGSFGAKLSLWKRTGLDPRGIPQFNRVDSALVEITRGSNTTPALGDLDGDGDLDLLIGEASGTLNYYRNDGTIRAPQFTLVSDQYDSLDVGRRSAPFLADIDGDGDLDLLVGSDDQGVVLYRNQGTKAEPRFVRDPGFSVDVPPLSSPVLVNGQLVVGNAGGGIVWMKPARHQDR